MLPEQFPCQAFYFHKKNHGKKVVLISEAKKNMVIYIFSVNVEHGNCSAHISLSAGEVFIKIRA